MTPSSSVPRALVCAFVVAACGGGGETGGGQGTPARSPARPTPVVSSTARAESASLQAPPDTSSVRAARDAERAAAPQLRLDTASFTERFETPEVVLRYQRGGWTGDVPPDPGATRTVRVEGPRPGTPAESTEGGPMYMVEVSWYPLAPEPDLVSWVDRHGDHEHDDEAENEERNGGPVIPAGAHDPDTIAGRPARRQELWGVEGPLIRRYAVAGPWVLVFRYDEVAWAGRYTTVMRDGPRAVMERVEWRP